MFSSYQNSDIDIRRIETNTDDIKRDIYAKDKYYTPSLDLFYRHKLNDKSGLEFNLVGTYRTSDYFRDLKDVYINQNDKQSYVCNDTDGDKESMIFEGLYYKTASKVGYSVGLRGSYSHTKNIYEHTNISKLKQMQIYPYAELNGRSEDFSYSIGTGVEVFSMDNYSQSKNYYRNLSTITLQYNISENWNLRYNISYRPSYPSLGDLSDIYQREDTLTVVRGNPAIKPSQTLDNRLRLTLNHKRVMLYASIHGQKTFDAINDEIFYDEDLKSVVIQKKNQPYTTIIGGSLEAIVPAILDVFTINVGAYWNRYQSKGDEYKYSLSNFNWLAMLNCQYKKFTLGVGYKKPETVLHGRYKNQLENYSAVNLSYKTKNLVFKTGVYFPFTSGTKYVNERISNIADSHVSRYIKDNANMVFVGITYNMNWGKSPFRIGKKLQNKDRDSGILKPMDH